ncbi:hypothetical protein GCM10012275_19750 [Longimycelium tulufanense]|uniref:Lantibiotic dehydratase N-terminal domain-containing protein n=1 Tax=Longimycelium tulufanense TaxID=907463 RepID=A0A8J3CCV3_9PSEU|nr:lantibiotic dehydratase [Longimycelium tulufanense]GGM48892.1 hypothetical protein GCM10012275_19750 [Longimycelium tulufanense]
MLTRNPEQQRETLVAAQPVLPAVIVRSCGLPVRALDATATPRTMECLRSALTRRVSAQRLSEEVGADLYDLVPQLDGSPDVRRAALRLRRDVHNLRHRRGQARDIEAVGDHLAEPAQRRLHQWFVALQQHVENMVAAERAAEAELSSVWTVTRDWLRDPEIALGLALASPPFTLRLLDGAARPAPAWDSRLARTATAYLTRAAVKTSPFSFLTTLGVTGWAAEGRMPARDHRERRSLSSSRSAALELFRSWAQHPEGPSDIEVIRNPSLRRVGDTLQGLLPLYLFSHGAFLRADEQTACGTADQLVAHLPPQRFPLRTPVAQGMSWRRVRRLISEGLLLPITPWGLRDGRHFRAFHRWLLERIGGGLLDETVTELARLEERIAQTQDPRVRATAAERTRRTLSQGFRVLGRRPPRWTATAPLFHELVAHDADRNPPLPDPIRADLREIASRQAHRTRRSALYDRLIDHFVLRHGAGGTAPDLLGFLYDFLNHAQADGRAGIENLQREFQRPSDTLPSPAAMRGHGTVGHAASTVFFQLAAEDLAAVERGNYTVVINGIWNGFAGLLARWSCLPVLHDQLAAPIGSWLAEQYPGCRVYQLSAQGDWVTFQRPALDSLPSLAWGPGLATGEPGVVDLRGFSLSYDQHTDTLQVRDASGPASFAYVGSIPPQALRGVDQLLCLLSDPWVFTPALPDDPPPLPRRDLAPPVGEVTHYPRVQHGRVVWRRARWRLHPGELPRPRSQMSPVEFLAEVEQWRCRQGIPRETFLDQAISDALGTIRQKPQWVDFDHASVVCSALRQIDPGSCSVEFVEALPSRHEHWWRNSAGDAIATEFITLVRHTEAG